jgi:ABC-2 type transport system permease protein
MLARIFNIARKELLQIRRDRRILPMVIISPVLQLLIYGYAISTTITNINTAVYDMDRTQQSRELIQTIGASGYLNLRYYATSEQTVDNLMDTGQASVVVVIPVDFAKDLTRGTSAPIQAIVDGSDPNVATTALGYISSIVQGYSQQIVIQRVGHMPAAGVDARIRVWYNPTLESKNYMIPAIIGLILLQITMNMTALSIVKERERGTIEQLVVTPIKKWELVAGKVLPYAGIGYLDVFLVLLAGTLIFGVPIRGSVLLLLGLSGSFLLSALGIGLFMSTISKNQQQATVAISFIMLPSFLLSGFFFPIANMPPVVQWITYLIPLRYYMFIVRAIFLKGAGFRLLWDQFLYMTILGVVILTVSVLGFRKKLE